MFLFILEEILGGFKIIKGFNVELIFNNKFKDIINWLFKFLNLLLNR